MFNKRESNESETPGRNDSDQPPSATRQPPAPARSAGSASAAATIGPTISIDGQLKGEEDLVVEGRIKGTVELKTNTLTVGTQGTLDAEVFAHSIFVEGTVNGDLYGCERISIRKSARISGNIVSPRISLEDGAKFRGSIDMNADSETFRKAFGGTSPAASGASGKPPAPVAVDSNKSSEGEKDKSPQDGRSSSAGGSANRSANPPGKTGSSAA